MEALSYTLIRSDRKTISIRITPEGSVEVRAPKRMPESSIRAFVISKEDWIRKHLQNKQPQLKLSSQEVRALADQALKTIPARVAHYAPLVGVTYGRITIRNQKTRWGSCSAKGNLNFNCLLMLTPPEIQDYVVIHELCHRKEMNHSPRFWAEVARLCPDYKAHRQWLKQHGQSLIAKLP